MTVDWIKWTYFCVNEFKVGINDGIYSGNEQQKVQNELSSQTAATWPHLIWQIVVNKHAKNNFVRLK